MKKISSAIMFLALIQINQAIAQSEICKRLRDDYENLESKIQRIDNLKLANEDFFSLMDNPQSTDGGIPEEIANYEHRINRLQDKITAGDNNPDLVMDIKMFQTRIQLLNMRMSRSYSKTVMLKDPRFVDQQKLSKNHSNDVLELKLELTRIGEQLKTNNCPAVKKDDIDDLLDDKNNNNNKGKEDRPNKPVTTGSFAGNWIYADPKMPDIPFVLSLSGSGSSTTGSMTLGIVEIPAKYSVSGCIENGENRLRCSFTSVMEDHQKYLDGKGLVEMILSGNNLVTSWKESAPGIVRWKPGFESTIKRVDNARTLPISFVRK